METRIADRDALIGVDLAQGGADYTAVAVLERAVVGDDPAQYSIIHLERWRDRRVQRIPERVQAIALQLDRVYRQRALHSGDRGQMQTPLIRLVVDQTGVGPFGLEPLVNAGFRPIGIVIHGGDAVSHPNTETYRVPKRDIAGAVNILLQSSRLKIAGQLPDASILRAELENFRAKISLKTGHDSYGAGEGEGWREGEHDDLVLAVGIACWLGEFQAVPKLDPLLAEAFIGLPR